MDEDSEHEADDDMGYDPSDVAFTEWLGSKNFNYKTMDHYTMKALWIYWIRGNDEVEHTSSENAVSSKPESFGYQSPCYWESFWLGQLLPLVKPLDIRKLESSSYHALGACFNPYKAFLRRKQHFVWDRVRVVISDAFCPCGTRLTSPEETFSTDFSCRVVRDIKNFCKPLSEIFTAFHCYSASAGYVNSLDSGSLLLRTYGLLGSVFWDFLDALDFLRAFISLLSYGF
ncbi:hypothetical protein Tco_1525172 [Tanacetum coccineum]